MRTGNPRNAFAAFDQGIFFSRMRILSFCPFFYDLLYFLLQEVKYLTQLEESTLNFDLAQGYALNALAGRCNVSSHHLIKLFTIDLPGEVFS